MAAATAPLLTETPDALLHRLEWQVLRKLDGLLPGPHLTARRGDGLLLEDLRPYQIGDDLRHIDWNLTARHQEPHVRQFAAERDLQAWFLVDASASMQPGGPGGSGAGAWPQALQLVAVLARVLVRQGGRVGALIYRPQAPPSAKAADARRAGPRIERVPAGAGRLQVLCLLSRLLAPLPAAAAAGTATRLGDLLQAADALLRRRSQVFVLSDFISEPGWQAPLGRLALRHDVLALRLAEAPLDISPGLDWLRVEDAETGEQLQLDAGDPGLRVRLQALQQARDSELRAGLAKAGVDVLELDPAEAVLDALLRYIALRRRRPGLTLGRRWQPEAAFAKPATLGPEDRR